MSLAEASDPRVQAEKEAAWPAEHLVIGQVVLQVIPRMRNRFFHIFFPSRAFTHRRVMFFPCKCLRLLSISIQFSQAKKQAREAEAARREEDPGGVLDRSFDLVRYHSISFDVI